MFISLAVRLGASLLLFALMAHTWGPERFGTFMYPFTIAALTVKVVDYGFVLQIVRDIAKTPNQARRILQQSLAAKLVLVVPLLAITSFVSGWIPEGSTYRALLWILTAEAVFNSFAMFLNFPFRALRQFGRETTVVIWGNISLIMIVGMLLISGAGPIQVAMGYAVSRLLYLFLSILAYRRAFGFVPRPTLAADTFSMLWAGLPFGIHLFVGTMYVQFDTLIVQHFWGADDVGVYQAGVRLLMGALLIGDALNNVYIAELSRRAAVPAEMAELGTAMTRHLLAIGLVGFAVMVGGADIIVDRLFGSEYIRLISLFPLFGTVLIVRYFGVSYGSVLTVADRQTTRMLAVSFVLFVNIGLNFVLIPRMGLEGALYSSVFSNVILYIVYMYFCRREVGGWMLERRTLALLSVAGMCGVMAGTLVMEDLSFRLSLAVCLVLFSSVVGVTRAEWTSSLNAGSLVFSVRAAQR